MNPETRFKVKVLKELKTLKNAWFYKTQEVARHGIPDIIACINGFFVALELKANEKGKLTALQTYTLGMIVASGGVGLTVHPGNWPETFEYLKKIDAGGFDPRAHKPPLTPA